MKNINTYLLESNTTTDEKLEAIHDIIEVLCKEEMQEKVEVLFNIFNDVLGEKDMIVSKFKQYAKEFNCTLD